MSASCRDPNSALVSDEKFKPTNVRRPVQRTADTGESHCGLMEGLEREAARWSASKGRGASYSARLNSADVCVSPLVRIIIPIIRVWLSFFSFIFSVTTS